MLLPARRKLCDGQGKRQSKQICWKYRQWALVTNREDVKGLVAVLVVDSAPTCCYLSGEVLPALLTFSPGGCLPAWELYTTLPLPLHRGRHVLWAAVWEVPLEVLDRTQKVHGPIICSAYSFQHLGLNSLLQFGGFFSTVLQPRSKFLDNPD